MNSAFLPNLFILGAAKCGTTTLHAFLRSLPDVCMSNPKEPFFFEAEYELGLEFYKTKYFSHWKGEKVIGESRHRNLIQPYVPARIHHVNPEAKLVVIVRDPVERSYSHWFHLRSTCDENLTFEDAIRDDLSRIQSGLACENADEIAMHVQGLKKRHRDGESGLGLYRTYLDSGYYMDQISRYLELFRKDQIKVIVFEEMTKNPEVVLRDLLTYLGLDYPSGSFQGQIWHNKKKINSLWKKKYRWLTKYSRFFPTSLRTYVKSQFVKQDQMKAKTRRWLVEHYRPHVTALEKFLNREIQLWQR